MLMYSHQTVVFKLIDINNGKRFGRQQKCILFFLFFFFSFRSHECTFVKKDGDLKWKNWIQERKMLILTWLVIWPRADSLSFDYIPLVCGRFRVERTRIYTQHIQYVVHVNRICIYCFIRCETTRKYIIWRPGPDPNDTRLAAKGNESSFWIMQ